MVDEDKRSEESKSLGDKVKDTVEGAKTTIGVGKTQTDMFRGMWDNLMDEMKEIEKLNVAQKNGEPVDLNVLHEHAQKVEKFIDDVQSLPGGGFMLRATMGPIRKEMHKWVSEIEKKQAELEQK